MPGTLANSGTRKWVTVPKLPPSDAPPYDDMMPREGTKQFRCFQIWLQMEEEERSLKKVALQTAVSATRLSDYAKNFRWADRASKFDQERRLYRLSKRNAKILRARDNIVRVATDRFNQMLPAELSPTEALRYIELADKLDRLDAGNPTDITREDLEVYKAIAIEVFQFLLDGVSDEWAERSRPLILKFEQAFGMTPKDPGMEPEASMPEPAKVLPAGA